MTPSRKSATGVLIVMSSTRDKHLLLAVGAELDGDPLVVLPVLGHQLGASQTVQLGGGHSGRQGLSCNIQGDTGGLCE